MRRLVISLLLSLYLLTAGATTHVNDSGTWRQLTGVYVNDSGTWREIQQVYVNDGGTWRTVFLNAVVALADQSATNSQFNADVTATFTIGSNGMTTSDSSQQWITPTSAAGNYEIRCTVASGALASGDTCDGSTWLALSSNRSWSTYAPYIGVDNTVSATLTLEIRLASGATVDSATITISATSFHI